MKVLITGGAGFIGSNVARRHLDCGDDVIILDNLSRKGWSDNTKWLGEHGGRQLQIVKGDVRERGDIEAVLRKDVSVVYHLAGQVAVTCSVADPQVDFDCNAIGTFNVLESVRKQCPDAVVLYASTNKVYGQLRGMPYIEDVTRYRYAEHEHGVSEEWALDFHTPYGCSKGCGDQYTRDYARTYGLRTVVFRQSCIYGPRQFGVEDQGWLAHFCIAAKNGRPIQVYGDGKQVRDILWVDDLLDAYFSAIEKIDLISGSTFNIGGGMLNTISVWQEFGPMLQKLAGKKIDVITEDWRPGDQRIYVSDIRKVRAVLGWCPKTSAEKGISLLWDWVAKHDKL